ncbi:MAG: alpha/beta hydrolase [Caldilineae bacterium]|nr:MAG: alpha/beta hydrolase [Caldilineae bacterium]
MPYCELEGQRIHYLEHRDDLRRRHIPLVLVHGAGGSAMHWPPALRRLPDHDVYALDLPGHGRSQGPGRDDIGAYAEVVHAWAEAIGLAPFVLAGHSMGGAIALTFALRYPAHLRGLGLVATGARLKVNPQILQGLRSDREGVGRLLVEWVHGQRASPAQKRQYLRHFLAVDEDVLLGDWHACDRFDLRDHLPDIRVPALVVSGSQDKMTPATFGQYLAERLPDADLTLIEGGGHMLMLEQPVLVTQAFAGFLARLERG